MISLTRGTYRYIKGDIAAVSGNESRRAKLQQSNLRCQRDNTMDKLLVMYVADIYPISHMVPQALPE